MTITAQLFHAISPGRTNSARKETVWHLGRGSWTLKQPQLLCEAEQMDTSLLTVRGHTSNSIQFYGRLHSGEHWHSAALCWFQQDIYLSFSFPSAVFLVALYKGLVFLNDFGTSTGINLRLTHDRRAAFPLENNDGGVGVMRVGAYRAASGHRESC